MYDPVGEVDVGCSIGSGGVVFEEAGDSDVEVWEGEDLLLPVFEGVDVVRTDLYPGFLEGAEVLHESDRKGEGNCISNRNR